MAQADLNLDGPMVPRSSYSTLLVWSRGAGGSLKIRILTLL